MSGWHFNVSAPLWDWVQGTIRPPEMDLELLETALERVQADLEQGRGPGA